MAKHDMIKVELKAREWTLLSWLMLHHQDDPMLVKRCKILYLAYEGFDNDTISRTVRVNKSFVISTQKRLVKNRLWFERVKQSHSEALDNGDWLHCDPILRTVSPRVQGNKRDALLSKLRQEAKNDSKAHTPADPEAR